MQNIRQYIWGLLGRFSPSLIFLGTTIVLARILTPDDFGVIGVLTIVLTVSEALTDAGLGGSLIKEKEISNIDCCTICNFNLFVSCILYLILFCSADWIENYFEISNLAIVTRLLSFTFVISGFSLVPRAIMIKNLQFREMFVISVVSSIVPAVASVISALYGAGLFSLIIYRLLSPLIGCIMSFYYSNFCYHFIFSKQSFVKLIPFGFYTSVSTVVDTVYENILTTIFGKVMGVTQTGLFYQAKKTEESLTTSLTSTIGNVAFPVLTRLRDDKERFVKESNSILLTVAGLMIPFVLLLSEYSDIIITLLYGDQWKDSAYFFTLLMYAGSFMILENLNRTFIKSLGQGRILFSIALAKRSIGILLLLISASFFKGYMVQTYVICSFIAYLVNQISLVWYLKKGFKNDICVFFKLLIPNAIMLFLFSECRIYVSCLTIQLLINISILSLYLFVYLPYIGVSVAFDVINRIRTKIR